jgi:hypothetical protein
MIYWKSNVRSVSGEEVTARDANLAVCRLEEVGGGRAVAGKEDRGGEGGAVQEAGRRSWSYCGAGDAKRSFVYSQAGTDAWKGKGREHMLYFEPI